jgi:hypothetical protein
MEQKPESVRFWTIAGNFYPDILGYIWRKLEEMAETRSETKPLVGSVLKHETAGSTGKSKPPGNGVYFGSRANITRKSIGVGSTRNLAYHARHIILQKRRFIDFFEAIKPRVLHQLYLIGSFCS